MGQLVGIILFVVVVGYGLYWYITTDYKYDEDDYGDR